MFSLRCTESQLARLVAGTDPPPICEQPTLPQTILGDWHVADLPAGGFLAMSSTTRLAVALPAVEVRDLPGVLRSDLAPLLEAIGIPTAGIAQELRAMRWTQFAPAGAGAPRADLERLLQAAAADAERPDPARDRIELAVRLGSLRIGSPHLGQGIPLRAAQELFGLPPESDDIGRAVVDAQIDGASPD